jgi:hypothetical protein
MLQNIYFTECSGTYGSDWRSDIKVLTLILLDLAPVADLATAVVYGQPLDRKPRDFRWGRAYVQHCARRQGYDPILSLTISNVPFPTTWLHDQVLSDFKPIQTQEGKSGNCNMSVQELALGIPWELGGSKFVPQPVGP